MPKILDYPRASLKKSLELAKAVDDLGGSCNQETCAQKLGMKLSGGFTALSGTVAKYGLIKVNKGNFSTTQTFKDYKLAYNDVEKTEILRKIVLSIPVFNKVYERFRLTKLPADILDKVLAKEFGVEEKVSKRVSGYFLEAAKSAKLLNPDSSFNDLDTPDNVEELNDIQPSNCHDTTNSTEVRTDTTEEFVVQINGPNISQRIVVDEPEHLQLVESVMNIIRKKINKKEDD